MQLGATCRQKRTGSAANLPASVQPRDGARQWATTVKGAAFFDVFTVHEPDCRNELADA